VRIRGVQHYLWRAVDQDGEVVDVFLKRRRDGAAAKRFFKRLLRASGNEPRRIITDKLRSYGVAHRWKVNLPVPNLRPVPSDQVQQTEQRQHCYPTRCYECKMSSEKNTYPAFRPILMLPGAKIGPDQNQRPDSNGIGR